MERDVWRGFSGTDIDVRFGFRGGSTTVNRMAVTALHPIMTHPFFSIAMFSVWIVHNNDD